jgi:WD40 repeat protein
MKIKLFSLLLAGLLVVLVGGGMAAPAPPAGRPKEIVSFQAHRYDVPYLAFSPDGKKLASGGIARVRPGEDVGKVKIWEVPSGKILLDIDAHQPNARRGDRGNVLGLAFSPDGKTLASCGDEGNLKLWDEATGKNTNTFSHCVGEPLFSPDGKELICGPERIDLATRKRRFLVENFTGFWPVVRYDAKGNVLAVTANTHWPEPPCIWLWNTAARKNPVTIKGHEKYLMRLALSRDCKIVASAGCDQTVRLWDTATGKNTATFDKLPKWSSTGLTFSPNGKILAMPYKGERASIRDPGHILLLEVPSGKVLADLQNPKGVVICVAFSPNGRLLASGGINGVIKIWSLPARYKAE